MARSPSKPITEHLAYLLAQANREINRQLDARFRAEGVPVEQWRILKVLSDGKGHSMGELAEAVLLNHPTLTKMVDRMVSDSLVYRVQDADDRRKVLMFSSDRGKALTQRLNSLALSQESYIAESYGNRATAELKRLLESLIEKAELSTRVRGELMAWCEQSLPSSAAGAGAGQSVDINGGPSFEMKRRAIESRRRTMYLTITRYRSSHT